MRRSLIGLFILQSLLSFSASASNSPVDESPAVIICSETEASSSGAQVQVLVTHVYDNTMVRVETHETNKDGIPVVTLNDLNKTPEQAQGVYQNHLFRLQIQPSVNSNGEQSAHIDFLYDQGIRFSADLNCQAWNQKK